MSDIINKASNQGNSNLPWNFGISPFDQFAIDEATGRNIAATANRYDQLGMGGSTPAMQDKIGAATMGEALTGELQTQNEGNAALNPALQPTIPLNPNQTTQTAQAENAAGVQAGMSGATT